MSKENNISETVHKYFSEFMKQNWVVVAEPLCDDFIFSSPKDDYISKEEHLKSCMLHSSKFKSINIEIIFVEGKEAFVRYHAEMKDGNSFRNTEFFVIENGKNKIRRNLLRKINFKLNEF